MEDYVTWHLDIMLSSLSEDYWSCALSPKFDKQLSIDQKVMRLHSFLLGNWSNVKQYFYLSRKFVEQGDVRHIKAGALIVGH